MAPSILLLRYKCSNSAVTTPPSVALLRISEFVARAIPVSMIRPMGGFQANFFLVKIGENALDVYEALMHEGVIVRTMEGYGLHHYLRISVGLASENEKLIKALKKIISLGK